MQANATIYFRILTTLSKNSWYILTGNRISRKHLDHLHVFGDSKMAYLRFPTIGNSLKNYKMLLKSYRQDR